MKRLAAIIVPLLILASCSGTERAEGITAEMEAAQMEGRSAAREFVATQWKDTLELQKRLLHVRARQSRYISENKPECGAAFDSGFVRTLRAVRPEIARLLDSSPQ